MKLSKKTLTKLAEMICGAAGGAGFEWPNFKYRTSYYLTEFFKDCDMDFVHDGTTRKDWVFDVLNRLNSGPASNPLLPANGILRVVRELLDPADFLKNELNRDEALEDLNNVLVRDNLQAYLDAAGRCYIRHLGTNATSATISLQKRSWTEAELAQRKAVSDYLDTASEDEFIENILVPIFSQLGYQRISVAGHSDKSLEYGKDLWMKYQLPTGHYIYFGTQAKKHKLDSSGRGANQNITEVLNQIRMMLGNPIWDPETNKKNLLDHVYIACAGDITKQAKNWLAEHLDQESRRHILFMDRENILDLCTGVNLDFLPSSDKVVESDDDLPF